MPSGSMTEAKRGEWPSIGTWSAACRAPSRSAWCRRPRCRPRSRRRSSRNEPGGARSGDGRVNFGAMPDEIAMRGDELPERRIDLVEVDVG
jgi:hypothetical protein